MKQRTRIWLGLLFGIVLFAVPSYSAEEKPKTNIATAPSVEAAWSRRLPEMDLGDNLPLDEVAKQLANQFREVNFIVPENARDATVPRLVLRNVTLDEILEALELVTEKRIRWYIPGAGPIGLDAAGLPVINRVPDLQANLVTFVVTKPPTPALPAAPPNPTLCRVFSLAPYLSHSSKDDADRAIESLYSAFETAWDMLKKSDRNIRPPALKIHDGTKLLIAVGREKELAVIEQIIKELQGSAPTRTIATPAENESTAKSINASPPSATGTKP